MIVGKQSNSLDTDTGFKIDKSLNGRKWEIPIYELD